MSNNPQAKEIDIKVKSPGIDNKLSPNFRQPINKQVH